MKFPLAVITATAAFALSSTACADATLVYTDSDSNTPRNIYIKDGRVLMESGEGESMLYEESRRTMTMIDHNRRAYFSFNPEQMAQQTQTMQQQAQSQMAPMLEQMKAQFEQILKDPNIPEAQKQALRQQMASFGAAGGNSSAGAPAAQATTTMRATGESRKIAGIKCKMHVVMRGPSPEQEVCVGRHSDAGISRQDYNTMQSMFALMQETAKKSMAGMGMALLTTFPLLLYKSKLIGMK